jgi:hypothetical protein
MFFWIFDESCPGRKSVLNQRSTQHGNFWLPGINFLMEDFLLSDIAVDKFLLNMVEK